MCQCGNTPKIRYIKLKISHIKLELKMTFEKKNKSCLFSGHSACIPPTCTESYMNINLNMSMRPIEQIRLLIIQHVSIGKYSSR